MQWLKQLFDHYNSGATTTFCLYGNTNDIFPYKEKEYLLEEFLILKAAKLAVTIYVDPTKGITLDDPTGHLDQLTPPQTCNVDEIFAFLDRALYYLSNLTYYVSVGIIFSNAQYLVGNAQNRPALFVKKWSQDPHLSKCKPLIVLLSESLQELHEKITSNQRIEKLEIPLPNKEQIVSFIASKVPNHPIGLKRINDNLDRACTSLQGTSLYSLYKLIKFHDYKKESLELSKLEDYKKQLVNEESRGLLTFLDTSNNLDQLVGDHNQAIRDRLRADIQLWHDGYTAEIPNGYLLVGPPGTGKTFFVRCLAGEGVPVVTINNFRGSYQGETEGNLELIFRMLKALPRVFVFVDEAEQALGGRQQSSTDGGVSGRVYSMFAQEMSNKTNKGKICWILATSHPHLLETDLKRPGRIDLKIPLLPCESLESSRRLVQQMGKTNGLKFTEAIKNLPPVPTVTPGMVDSIIGEVKRLKRQDSNKSDTKLLNQVLETYQPPNQDKMLELTIEAIKESSSLSFVPKELHNLLKI